MLSRKQFFKECGASLAKSILEVGKFIAPAVAQVDAKATERSLQPESTGHLVATTRSRYCLASGSGCAACLERCKSQAIEPVPGEGIRIDPSLCVGCGTCEKLCPSAPKAIQLRERSAYDDTVPK